MAHIEFRPRWKNDSQPWKLKDSSGVLPAFRFVVRRLGRDFLREASAGAPDPDRFEALRKKFRGFRP